MDRSLPDRLGPWPIRTTWLLLPFLVGPALGDSLADSSRPVQIVASVGLWAGWAGVLGATLVPLALTLTVVRLAAPGPTLAVLVGTIADLLAGDSPSLAQIVGLTWALVTAGTAFLPSTGATFVNGSSYGDEVRLPLRVPGPLLMGPVQLVWALLVAAVVTGPLLLAAKVWLPGVIALGLGVPLAGWSIRRLHELARRWTVFVPGGLVLHDPMALADPVLFRRVVLAELGPAPADNDALDLTQRALGLAVQARFAQPLPLVLVARRGTHDEAARTVETSAVLFTPTQPGLFLTTARARSLIRSST